MNKAEELKKIQEKRTKYKEELEKLLEELDDRERQIRFAEVPSYVGKYIKINYYDLCTTSYIYVTEQELNSSTDCVILKGEGIDEVLTMKFSSLSIKSTRSHSISIHKLDRIEEISKDVFTSIVNRMIKSFTDSFRRSTNIESYD